MIFKYILFIFLISPSICFSSSLAVDLYNHIPLSTGGYGKIISKTIHPPKRFAANDPFYSVNSANDQFYDNGAIEAVVEFTDSAGKVGRKSIVTGFSRLGVARYARLCLSNPITCTAAVALGEYFIEEGYQYVNGEYLRISSYYSDSCYSGAGIASKTLSGSSVTIGSGSAYIPCGKSYGSYVEYRSLTSPPLKDGFYIQSSSKINSQYSYYLTKDNPDIAIKFSEAPVTVYTIKRLDNASISSLSDVMQSKSEQLTDDQLADISLQNPQQNLQIQDNIYPSEVFDYYSIPDGYSHPLEDIINDNPIDQPDSNGGDSSGGDVPPSGFFSWLKCYLEDCNPGDYNFDMDNLPDVELKNEEVDLSSSFNKKISLPKSSGLPEITITLPGLSNSGASSPISLKIDLYQFKSIFDAVKILVYLSTIFIAVRILLGGSGIMSGILPNSKV